MPFLLALLLFVAAPLLAADDAPRTINADWTVVKGPTSRVWQNCVGAGRANEGLRADWQQQLAEVQRDIGFRYIRFHGLFHDDMGVYKEGPHGEPIYNWQYVDKLFDFLLSVKIHPFVELGFLPSAMQSDPTKTIFWWKGHVSPPKDFKKWGDLVTALVRHCEERYGQAEVKQWYFEVWNEPNLHEFWSGTRDQYFQLYDVSARAVKSVSSEYRVGGPASAGSAWLDTFIPFVVSGQIPIDFISTHAYGTDAVLDEYGKKTSALRSIGKIPDQVVRDRALIDANPLKGRELHFTEWNSSPSPNDLRHDTYQNAAFVLHVLRHAEAADSMSLWTFTDIFEEPGPQFGPFHGGFGLLNLQGIRKPTFYAYEFLRALGPTELQNADGNSYVCRDDAGNFQILLWDFAAQPDQAYADAFFSNGDHPEDRGSIQIAVKNVPSGSYRLSVYRTGYAQNDPFNAFRAMGSPQNLTREQESKLKALSDGHAVEEADAGKDLEAVCRKHNVSPASFYRWKKKYGGMELKDARKYRQLEKENGELKQMLADSLLKIRVLEEVNAKKGKPFAEAAIGPGCGASRTLLAAKGLSLCEHLNGTHKRKDTSFRPCLSLADGEGWRFNEGRTVAHTGSASVPARPRNRTASAGDGRPLPTHPLHHFPDVRGEVALERAQRRIAHAKLLLELVHRLAFPADFKWGSALKDYGSTPVREVIGEAVPPLFTRLHGSVLVEILKNQAGPVVPITLSDKRCGNAREKLDMPLPTLGPRKIGSHVIVI